MTTETTTSSPTAPSRSTRSPFVASLAAAALLLAVGCGVPAPKTSAPGGSGDASSVTPSAAGHTAHATGSGMPGAGGHNDSAAHPHGAHDAAHEAHEAHEAHDAHEHEAHDAHEHDAHAGADAHASHMNGLPASRATEHSVYLLPSSWTDQAGEPVELDDLAGRAQVVAMVYTHCSFACPRLLAQMKRMEAVLEEEGLGDRVGFTLISIDPERDTPERLARFAESSRLQPERWTLLNGSDDDIRALSILLGIQYRGTEEGQFEHSNVLTVLDMQGVPVHRLEGLNADPTPALEALRRVVE